MSEQIDVEQVYCPLSGAAAPMDAGSTHYLVAVPVRGGSPNAEELRCYHCHESAETLQQNEAQRRLEAGEDQNDPRPKCSVCRRRRDPMAADRPMDRYDYSPVQVVTGSPLGWYSGDDGEVCPEDMEKMIRPGDRRRPTVKEGP